MIEVILYGILFIMGIYFGSFFTLATYRLPKQENITYKHSYCPNCNHKLGVLELVPLLSYLFLGGKCKHCNQKIGIRYFIIEFLTGISFVLFGLSLHLNFPEVDLTKIGYLILGILYFSSLFIIAGIDKEKQQIQKSVLLYGVVISLGYMIYAYTLYPENVYAYVIYLIMMVVLLFADTTLLKKNLKYTYVMQLMILALYMLIFSGPYSITITIVLTILAMGIENIIRWFKRKNSTKITNKASKKPVAFFMCISNIITIIIVNYVLNYMLIS